MQWLIRWVGTRGSWRRSRYSDLPELHPSAAPLVNQYCVVAGGLVLILSRRPRRELAGDLLATQELYHLLRKQLRDHGRAKPGATLLSEVMHEVATLADPGTRAALKACFELRTKAEAQKRDLDAAATSVPDSLVSTAQALGHQPSARSSMLAGASQGSPSEPPSQQALNDDTGRRVVTSKQTSARTSDTLPS